MSYRQVYGEQLHFLPDAYSAGEKTHAELVEALREHAVMLGWRAIDQLPITTPIEQFITQGGRITITIEVKDPE